MEKLLGILVAAAGVTETEAAELVTTDEGIAELLQKTNAKLADVKKNADGRALKSTREKVEAALKAKGIENPSFERFAEHLDELEGKSVESATKDKLSDEQILKLPAVVAYKNQLALDADRKVQAAKQEAADSLKADRDAFQQEKTESVVRAWAKKQVADAKPVFSSDPKIAANQEADLVDKLVRAAKWKTEGGLLQMLDAEGELLKDASLNIIKPEVKAREIITSYYQLPVSTHKDSAGIVQDDVRRNPIVYTGPKTKEDYQAQLVTLNTPQERKALTDSFEAYQKETTTA